MKTLGILAALVVILLAIPLGAVFLLNRSLQSPEFRELVLRTVQEAIGTDVSVGDMQVSILQGVSLAEVRISNPSNLPGEFFTASELLLRHQLMPLLSRRVQIDRLAVEKPVVRFLQTKNEKWNFELFQAGQKDEEERPSELAPDEPSDTGGSFDIALSDFFVSNGELTMLASDGRLLAQAQDIDLTSSVSFIQEELKADGELSLDVLNIGESLFARRLAAPVTISSGGASVAPIRAELAGGEFSGDIRLETTPVLRYLLNVQLGEADVTRLMQEANIESRAQISGRLQAAAQVEGTGGLPTMVGQGRAQVVGGKLAGVPAQNLLATLLQVPALREIDFEECLVEFNLANNVLNTPVIRLISRLIQITGQGSLSLEHNALDHQLTFVGKQELLASTPQPVLRVFEHREDGSYALEFRVWGPYDSPKTDLQQRLLGGAARDLIRRGLRRLFR